MSSQTNDALWGEGQIPFETVVETISEGILIVTLEGDIVYVNEAMADMIGYRPDEMVGCHLFEFMSDTWARRARQNLERRRDGVAEQFDHQFEHKEGHPVWTLVSAKPMADPEGRRVGSLVAIQDISERKRMERELIEARDLLEERVEQRTEQLVEANERLTAEIEVRREAEEQALEASRAKSTFLANMSHELRTPLNAVIGYTELVQEELQTGGELSVGALIGDLDKVHRAAKHLLSLINDVLDLSKVEAGKMDVHFETIDPGQLVEEVLVTLEPLIEQGNNTVEFSDAYGGTIATDRTKLKQVLVNLVGNAAKFTEEGQIEVSLVEATVAEGNGVRLDVSDTGVGMPEDELERLFEPFTQADESTTRQYGGTGLGLTICRRFCDMLGGEIEAESIEGEGTTFSVYLPQEQPEATLSDSESLDSSLTLPSASKEQNVDPNDVDGPTVLVIDDDDSVHDLMRRFLTPHGFCVVSEKRGDTGLERAHKLRPDVIVLDVMMPGRDGWSVLSQLKSDEELESIPVVMVTMVDDEEIGYALGASEYLVKPIDRERLVRVLSRFRSGADATALVVEDENAIRELMAHNLRKAGWQVETAADGREALDRLERMLPDVIVLDLMMPRMDGFEVAEALRHDVRLRDIPIVVVTAMDLDEAEKRRLEETVERILSKDATSTDQLLAEVLEASGMSVQSVEEDTSRSTGGSRTSIAESVHLNP